MSPGVLSCPPGASLTAVAARMVTHAIHAVAVMPFGSGVPPIVTDLDLVRGARDGALTVADLVLEPADVVLPDATLAVAVAAMAVQDVPHLVVLEADADLPAGMLSSFDVAAVVAGYDTRAARIVRPLPARPMISATTLEQATVRQVMHPGVVACRPAARLAEVARTMVGHHVHVVAVTGVAYPDGDGHLLWGLVDDMAVIHALHRGDVEAEAGSMSSSQPLALSEDATLDHAAALMAEHGRRHVVAVDRDGQPSGIVSTLDVARILAAP